MGIEAIYPKPNTSKPNYQNKTYPYLLGSLEIDRPNPGCLKTSSKEI